MGENAFYDLAVNGVPLTTYGGSSLLDYRIGETELKTDVFQGINRTNWRVLQARFGMRPVEITVVFRGRTLHEAKAKRSAFNAALFPRCDLFIPEDGFWYNCYPSGLGVEELVGIGEKDAAIKSRVTLRGFRHDAPESVTVQAGGVIYCRSTMPFTACRMRATVTTSAANYQLGGAVFHDVSAGQTLVFDGVDGKILCDGQPYAAHVDFVELPALVPGENSVDAPDAVTVEYAPTYI